MQMNVKFFYVGHGAMNYVQIFNNKGAVISHFLIDAGSTDDKYNQGEVQNQNLGLLQTLILTNMDSPLVIIITHLHKDHYNLLNELNIPDISNFYLLVGSVIDESYFLSDSEDELACFWNLHRQMNKQVVSYIGQPTEWSEVELGDVKLYLLWNNYFLNMASKQGNRFCGKATTSEYNSNGLAVAFLTDKHAVIFSGDMTGKNFDAIWSNIDLRKNLYDLLGTRIKLMTVPHHGSLHTLLEPSGNPVISLKRYPTMYYNTQRLKEIITNVFGKVQKMYISAGLRDRFCHPDYAAVAGYSKVGYGLLPASFEVYKQDYDVDIKTNLKFTPIDPYRQTNTWGTLEIQKSNISSILGEEGGYVDVTL